MEAAHVRDRIARLELATKFRPLHIQVLLVAFAPSRSLADDFYWHDCAAASAHPSAPDFRRQVFEVAGVRELPSKNIEAALLEFQRLGFFLAHLHECPLDGPREPSEADSRLASSLALRVRHSYKPKQVVLLGSELQSAIPALRNAGLGNLLANEGSTVPVPADTTPEAWSQFRELLAETLRKTRLSGGH